MCAKKSPLIRIGDGLSDRITVIAPNIAPAPRRCIAPKTRSVAKKRSAIMPTKNGEMMPAIGPTA